MQAITLITPVEAGGEMFQRMKAAPFLDARASSMRPVSQVSEATEIFDTDFEDESDYGGTYAKSSFESVSLGYCLCARHGSSDTSVVR